MLAMGVSFSEWLNTNAIRFTDLCRNARNLGARARGVASDETRGQFESLSIATGVVRHGLPFGAGAAAARLLWLWRGPTCRRPPCCLKKGWSQDLRMTP